MRHHLIPLALTLTLGCSKEEMATDDDLKDVSADVSSIEEAQAQAAAVSDDQDSRISDLLSVTAQLEARVAELEGRADQGESTIDAIEQQLGELGDASVSDQISSLSSTDASLQASIDALSVELSTQGQRGQSWHTTGTTSGRCGSLTIEATLDRPLVIIATVETSSITTSGACYSSTTRCAGWSDEAAESSTEATLTLLDSSGATISTTSSAHDFETEAGVTAYTALTDYGFGHDRTTIDTSHIPMVQVVEISDAGDYTVNLDVDTDGQVDACSLTVIQP